MKEVVFIVNSVKQARCIRRIEDFIDNGYNVHVFGFDRGDDKRKLPNLNIKIIGEIENGGSYLKRFFYIRKKIKDNVCMIDNNIIFYLFNFDIAFAFLTIFGKKRVKYIYEVSDLAELTISNKIIRNLIVFLNRNIMNNAFENVFTSEGFYNYYFGEKEINNVSLLQNKLNKRCLDLPFPSQRNIETEKIKIGFTGIIRFESIYNFSKVVADSFPNIELHFFGIINNEDSISSKIKDLIDSKNNIFYHGTFKNPDDFPKIYSNIDMVLALYTPSLGVKYAEPNKLFEAIYYEKPIIVSENTFLGEKVKKLNVGFVINAMDLENIKQFLSSLTMSSVKAKSEFIKLIPKHDSIDDTISFFNKLQQKLLCLE